MQFRTLNPNGEYVKGYGHAIVQKQETVGLHYYCVSCGWQEGGNPIIVDPSEVQP